MFCGFIGVFFLLFVLMPDRGFSEQENRELTQAPRFTLDALFGGQFTTRFEDYTTDQFPFRDGWTTIKARMELFAGKQENNGIYLCAGDTLIEEFVYPDQKQLDANTEAVASLAENAGVPVYFCLIPGVAELRGDLLPANAPNDSQLDMINYCYSKSGKTVNIDMYSALAAHSQEYIFYRTDHHWTSLGAYYGYAAIMEAMGRSVAPLSGFEPRTVTEEFYGTVYSKSGMSWVGPDSIQIFADQAQDTQVFNYVSGTEEETALYDMSFLEKKDKYSMFLGGISPLIKVSGGNSEAPSLLILRDSYTDSLIPFIQGEFSEIHIMDLRYYKTQLYESSIGEYVAENGIDEILVCYSAFNFGTDVNVVLMG
jgi:hypothetical protein